MAHKKGGGSSTNGRDSNAQRLGVKAFGGELVTGGSIITRQRGTRIKPGANVGIGSDDTLFAKVTAEIVGEGRGDKILVFHFKRKKQYKKLQGHRQNFTQVRIQAIEADGVTYAATK